MSATQGTSIDTRIKIVWGFYLITALFQFPAVIGVILAYLWRDRRSTDPMQSHFDGAIRVFWWFALMWVIGVILAIIYIGLAILFVAGVYLGIMGAIGLVRIFDNKPWI
ncbi:DUF4870 family protein [Acuticoccus kandeliae]|uniref:DUF4870 family protein n=1 Tax=Acuticoccus kandeliae TaxID=2073160 RepID=UPI000D3E90E8|nr:hypothetical protein [Acuticoccus kandeliae]